MTANPQHALVMILRLIDDLLLDLEIAYGTGEEIVICKKNGRGEDQLETNACFLEYVGGRERVAICRDLLHSGDALVNLADDAVILAVDGRNSRDGVGTVGPMHSVCVGKSVSLGPYAEERVDGDQRICGGSEFHNFSPLNYNLKHK